MYCELECVTPLAKNIFYKNIDLVFFNKYNILLIRTR